MLITVVPAVPDPSALSWGPHGVILVGLENIPAAVDSVRTERRTGA